MPNKCCTSKALFANNANLINYEADSFFLPFFFLTRVRLQLLSKLSETLFPNHSQKRSLGIRNLHCLASAWHIGWRGARLHRGRRWPAASGAATVASGDNSASPDRPSSVRPKSAWLERCFWCHWKQQYQNWSLKEVYEFVVWKRKVSGLIIDAKVHKIIILLKHTKSSRSLFYEV